MLSIRGGILGSSIITVITGIFLGALVDANLSTYILESIGADDPKFVYVFE